MPHRAYLRDEVRGGGAFLSLKHQEAVLRSILKGYYSAGEHPSPANSLPFYLARGPAGGLTYQFPPHSPLAEKVGP